MPMSEPTFPFPNQNLTALIRTSTPNPATFEIRKVSFNTETNQCEFSTPEILQFNLASADLSDDDVANGWEQFTADTYGSLLTLICVENLNSTLNPGQDPKKT